MTRVGTSTESPAESAESGKRTRQRSSIAFPYEDLEAAVKMVELAHKQYGGQPTLVQLAARMDSNVKSGSFRLKVSACRLFGLGAASGGKLTVSDLGVRATDARTGRAARAEAFLRPPLYKALLERFADLPLPDDQGLEQVIRDLGVPTKQVTHARQVFQRSARSAGFFEHGHGRLVPPATGTLPPEQGNVDERRGGGHGQTNVQKHSLIVGLLDELPPVEQGFPKAEREEWLKALDMNLSIIYRRSTGDARSEVPSSHGQTPADNSSHQETSA